MKEHQLSLLGKAFIFGLGCIFTFMFDHENVCFMSHTTDDYKYGYYYGFLSGHEAARKNITFRIDSVNAKIYIKETELSKW